MSKASKCGTRVWLIYCILPLVFCGVACGGPNGVTPPMDGGPDGGDDTASTPDTALDGGTGTDTGTSFDIPGACTTAAQCNDSIDCTDDTCVAGNCVHTPVPARCMAGFSCDLHTGCRAGRACATTTDCADTDPCTVNERCDSATRVCLFDLLDGDHDGFPPRSCGGGDCDDSHADVHPGATEVCNGIDDNCNGLVDEPPAGTECGTGFLCRSASCACASATASPCPPIASSRACVDLMTDRQNCGACGHVCFFASHATATCMSGACSVACSAGYVICGSACADTTSDSANCGACDHACPGGMVCTASACTTVLRPIAPLSTATTTSQRPTFRWSLAPGFDGARVEICASRACTAIEQTIDATGVSARPTVALTAGVHYWRLHGRSGGTTSSTVSSTWEVVIGHRTAPVDTSWGTVADFNGDGYADVVVGADGGGSGAGRAYVYLGSATGLATTPATTLTGPDGGVGEFGRSVASAGDVNGDGYADLVVGAPNAPSPDVHSSDGAGRAYVYLGSATGLATTPATTLVAPETNGQFGLSVASAGDVNGDGYADLVVGGYSIFSLIGRAYVYLGSATGPGATPASTRMGGWAASAGDFDLNGDGYADLVFNGDVFLGGASGLATTPATPPLTGGPGHWDSVAAGDVNGDGYADIVVGSMGVSPSTGIPYGPGNVYVYLGSTGGLTTTPTTTLTGPDSGNSFGGAVASAGDLNGDGYADLVVGSFCAPYIDGCGCGAGQASIYLGSAAGLATTPSTTLTGPDRPGGYFGVSVASAGDLNGDGYADLVVGSNAGRAYAYPGSAGARASTPPPPLSSPDVADSFGSSVASAGDLNDADCAGFIGLSMNLLDGRGGNLGAACLSCG